MVGWIAWPPAMRRASPGDLRQRKWSFFAQKMGEFSEFTQKMMDFFMDSTKKW